MILVITPRRTWQKIEVIHLADGTPAQKSMAYELVSDAVANGDDMLQIALTDIEYVSNWLDNNVVRKGWRRWFIRYGVSTVVRTKGD